ncbi:MAG: aminotransferase class I/II-fold pyridoxal phosphate-dependent enzyme, partial [Alphaproteobacteria bacterium]
VKKEPQRRRSLWENCAKLQTGLKALGYALANSQSQIMPLMIGDADECMRLSERLLGRGIFAQGIRPPTVPAGTSRLRVTVMATHTGEHLQRALSAFEEIANERRAENGKQKVEDRG